MTLTIGIIIFCVFDTIVVVTIMVGAVRMTWNPLQDRHPAREPRADAVSRNFQSFRFGLVNMGGMVHVSVDEGHLHLNPAAFIRRMGARPVSVPSLSWYSPYTACRMSGPPPMAMSTSPRRKRFTVDHGTSIRP